MVVARVESGGDSAVAGVLREPRLFAPAAIRHEAGEAFVWMVDEGILQRRPVVAGPVTDGRREIRSGLAGGELIVVPDTRELRERAALRVHRP